MVKYNSSNGWALPGLLRPYCVSSAPSRWAKRLLLEAGRWAADGRAKREREAEDRGQCGKVMRLLRAAAQEREGFRGQFGKGNSGAGAFSVVRLRGEVSRRSGRFRWGSLYGKGGGVAEKRWGSRRKG